MDIEMAKRVNALAKEFLDRGVAKSSYEASQLAETMLKKELPKEVSVKTTTSSETQEVLIQKLEKKFFAECNSIREELSKVINSMNEAITEINNLKKKIEESSIKKIEEKQKVLQEPKEVKTGNNKAKETGSNQRTGNWKPEDVDINKIFYYGTK